MLEIKCEYHNHLNKKFFKKQVVFSTSSEVLNPELPYQKHGEKASLFKAWMNRRNVY